MIIIKFLGGLLLVPFLSIVFGFITFLFSDSCKEKDARYITACWGMFFILIWLAWVGISLLVG